MSTLIKYEFFKAFRNIRFIIFTIVFPILFYIGLNYLASNNNNSSENTSMILYIICGIFGVVGSGLISLSTRITREKKYLQKTIKVTPFNIVKYIFISGIVQLLLNVIILLSLALVGLKFSNLIFDLIFVKVFLVILLFSLFFIFLGLTLGFIFDVVSLQAVSFPIYMIMILGNITDKLIPQIPEVLTNFQKFLPGYYATSSISGIMEGSDILNSLAILLLFIIGMFLVCVLIISMFVHKSIKR